MTHTFFDYTGNPSTIKKSVDDLWRQLIGTPITEYDLLSLLGAPAGSVVSAEFMDWMGIDTGCDAPPTGLFFTIQNDQYFPISMCVGVFKNEQGQLCLYLKDIHTYSIESLKGLGGLCLHRMVHTGAALGIKRIYLLAWGGRLCSDLDENGERWKGYTTWPKYGFDMPLHNENAKIVFSKDPHDDLAAMFPFSPKGLGECKSVQDVLSCPDGKMWWRIYGTGWLMTFDCHDQKAINILENDLASRNLLGCTPVVSDRSKKLSARSSTLRPSHPKLSGQLHVIESLLRQKILGSTELGAYEFFDNSITFELGPQL